MLIRYRWSYRGLAAGLLSLCTAAAAHAALIAETSFEASEGYSPAGTDVRDYAPADGDGWGGNTWEGENGGDDYTPVVSDPANAFDGDQFLQMHREREGDEKREIKLRRKFDTSLVTDERLVASWAMRLVSSSPLGSADYFDGGCNVSVEVPPSSGIQGDKNVHLEFRTDGELQARGADGGDDVVIGHWDDPNGGLFAYDTWITVLLDIDIAAQQYDLYINGDLKGADLDFRSSVDAGEELAQIRFFGPRAFDGNPNDGVWYDKVTLATDFQEPVNGCMTQVAPGSASVSANLGPPLVNPDPVIFTLQNIGTPSINYTVAELNDAQQPGNVSWLELDNSGGTLASLESATITASIDATGLSPGNYTAYVSVSDDCAGADAHLQRIDLTVIGCTWTVDSCDQVRAVLYDYPGETPDDAVFRMTNTGTTDVSYNVTKSGSSCFDWLIVNNPTGIIPSGEFVDVVASIDPQALADQPLDDSFTCNLTFADAGCSLQTVERQVRVRTLSKENTQVFTYHGDVDPESDDSAGPGLKFTVRDGIAQGQVETDEAADNDLVWHIIDPDNAKTKFAVAAYDPVEGDYDPLNVYSEAGATMVARVRVRDHSGSREGGLFLWEEDSISAGYYWGGPSGVIEEVQRDGMSTQVAGDDAFHILRLTAVGRNGDSWDCSRIVRLYFDENPVPVLELVAASQESDSEEGFGFGAGSTSGTYDIAFDWVSGTNAGAFAPGEEEAVLGASLIPQYCQEPFADADGDGDVDQDDFAVLQTCLTGMTATGGLSRQCGCFDRVEPFGAVSDADVAEFEKCATGPDVPFDMQSPPIDCMP